MTEDELKAARLDDARALEALRICEKRPSGVTFRELAETAARLAREGWTPPVDPDAVAFREWWESKASTHRPRDAYLAGARMAREQEQERAKVLVEPAEAIVNRAVRGTGSNGARWVHIVKAARRLEEGLTAYKAGKAAQ